MTGKYESYGLQDQVAIVTGASEGIGRSLAEGLALAGVHVALVSRTQEKLEQAAQEIGELADVDLLVVRADVSVVSEIKRMIETVHAHYGRIDILVNNAAWTMTRYALEVDEAEWDQTVDTSLKSVFFASQAVAPIMMAQGKGNIINIGSTLAKVAFARRPVYCAAKAGVHHLTRCLAHEWGKDGIRVNAVCPSVTETPTRRNLFGDPEYVEWIMKEKFSLDRWAQPEDHVGALLFLCSDMAEFITGHNLMVDGGWTIH